MVGVIASLIGVYQKKMYAVRGGIIDVFPALQKGPIRIEMDGSRVSSMRTFNITSQESIKKIDEQTLDVFYLSAPRGEIYDTNSEKLATSSLEPHLFLNLRKINDDNIEQYKQYLKYNFQELKKRLKFIFN